MAWLFMICGLAVTVLSLDVGLAVPWLIAAVVLVVLAVVLLIGVPFGLTVGLESE